MKDRTKMKDIEEASIPIPIPVEEHIATHPLIPGSLLFCIPNDGCKADGCHGQWGIVANVRSKYGSTDLIRFSIEAIPCPNGWDFSDASVFGGYEILPPPLIHKDDAKENS